MRIQPERVREIQQALKDAGYFEPEPHGKYDEATQEAMRRYQADNGFPASGLPESRTLMKLGLGPRPLPDDVDPLKIVAARALSEPSEEAEAEEAAAAEESETESNGIALPASE
jgi:peptidoglycan hydrolase-like protein with peptidoglycan-binding domain